jgi:hypothetical protein
MALINTLGAPQSIMTGKNILGARIYAPLPPDDAIAGVAILLAVVPKVIAAVPVPVFRMATRNARVGVLVINCNASDAPVVRSKRNVGERIFKESMIILVIEMFKLSYVFGFLHQKNKKRPPLLENGPFPGLMRD